MFKCELKFSTLQFMHFSYAVILAYTNPESDCRFVLPEYKKE